MAMIQSDTGRPADEQQAFGDGVNGGGGLWLCVRSIDELMRGLAAA